MLQWNSIWAVVSLADFLMHSPRNSSSSDAPPSSSSEAPIVMPAQWQWIQQLIVLVSTTGSEPCTRIFKFLRQTMSNTYWTLSNTVSTYPTICRTLSCKVKCTHHTICESSIKDKTNFKYHRVTYFWGYKISRIVKYLQNGYIFHELIFEDE